MWERKVLLPCCSSVIYGLYTKLAENATAIWNLGAEKENFCQKALFSRLVLLYNINIANISWGKDLILLWINDGSA